MTGPDPNASRIRAGECTDQTNRCSVVSHGAAIRSSAENHAGTALRCRRLATGHHGQISGEIRDRHRGENLAANGEVPMAAVRRD